MRKKRRGSSHKANCFNNSDFCASREEVPDFDLACGPDVGRREVHMEGVVQGQSGEGERVWALGAQEGDDKGQGG